MFKPVRKAVFPVAGLGTRVLPATKVMPKEMLTVVDKPLIQICVEEARAAGIEDFIFVTGRGKSVMEDHFDHAFELERVLRDRGGKEAELKSIQDVIIPAGRLFYTRQQQPLGLGHAVWCAREYVGDEPFAVFLTDDLVLNEPGCLSQMIEAYNEVGGNVVAVEDVPRDKTDRYGILDVVSDDGRLARAKGLVEKPKPKDAPSTLSIIGRYILQPEVFTHLAKHERGAGGEIQLTDSMAKTIGDIPFHGFRFKGRRFDCGTKAGFIAANLAYALARPDLKDGLREFLKTAL
jgi:UTP--glucose-1-phosphate uridylyltransferase